MSLGQISIVLTANQSAQVSDRNGQAARLYSSVNGGLLSEIGQISAATAATLVVWVDDSRSYVIRVFDAFGRLHKTIQNVDPTADSETPAPVAGGGNGGGPAPVSWADRAVARYPAKRGTGLVPLYFPGDSFVAGLGSTGNNTGFAQRLATKYAAVADSNNYGFSGRPVHMYANANRLFGTGPANSSKVEITKRSITCTVIGMNDIRGANWAGTISNGCGPNPDNWGTLQSKVQAMATYFCIPEINKVRMLTLDQSGLNPAVTFSGTWTIGYSSAGMPAVAYSSTTGCSVTVTTAVGNLLVLRIGRESTVTGKFSVTVDGVSYGEVTIRSAYESWAQDCVIFRLPTVAAHTVVLTSTVSANNFFVESIDCVDTTTDFSATLIYSGIPLLADGSNIGWGLTGSTLNSASANSATGALAWNYGNGNAKKFMTAVDDAMAELFELGFNVVAAPVMGGWVTAYMTNADTIHPSDMGHSYYLSKFDYTLGRLLAA